MKVQRTGSRPLEFDGEELAQESGRILNGKERNRWHVITVWKTTSGKFVVGVQYHTQWEGESDWRDAMIFDDLNQSATFLEEYIFPNIASIGYPPAPTYAERQARMMADLDSAWKTLVGKVLDQLGATEKI
jgi:hypothetical protein